jgi:hypothetical protein
MRWREVKLRKVDEQRWFALAVVGKYQGVWLAGARSDDIEGAQNAGGSVSSKYALTGSDVVVGYARFGRYDRTCLKCVRAVYIIND